MQTVNIYCVLGSQIAANGPQDVALPKFNFFADDDYTIVLNAQTPVLDNSSVNRFNAASFPFVSFEAALGVLDATPISGQWTMGVVGDTNSTSQLDSAITPALLQSALNALASVTAAGGVSVVQGNTANVWVIYPNTAGVTINFEIRETNLVPLCLTKCKQGANTNGTFTMVKLFKAPYAYTDSFDFPNPPEVIIALGRTGTSSANCIQYLTIPDGAMGDFDLVYNSTHTVAITTDSPSAATIATALNSLFADGATNPRFSVTSSVGNVFQITCIGLLGNQAVPLLGYNMYGQAPLQTPSAVWHLAEVPVELAVAGLPNTTMILCIVGTDSEGNESTLVQQAATVTNRMITPGTRQAIAAVATVTTIVYQTADPTSDATLIGQRSSKVDLAGNGTGTQTDPQYIVGFVHDLSTLTPGLQVWQRTNVSPEKWRMMTDTEYNAASVDGDPNTVTLTFAFTPPGPGNIGAIRVYATNWDASVYINNTLKLPLTSVYRASDNVTLDSILATLASALPTGWPSLPAGMISGTISPGQIDLTALANSLANVAAFLTTLQTLVKDSTVINNIAAGLSSSTNFVTTLTTILGTDGNASILQSLVAALLANAPFAQGVNTLITQLIQGGSAALNGTISFVLPTINWTYPPLNADGSQPMLPSAQVSVTSLGSTGYFIAPADGTTAAKTWTITEKAYLAPGQRKTFYPGETIYSTGKDWFTALLDGTTAYSKDFEKELFTIYVNDGMLVPNTQFYLLFQFGLSIAGNCEGHWLFQLRRGTPQAASGSSNLTVETWDETIFSTKIIITDATVIHQFGYQVTRAADSGGSPVLTAKKQAYTLQSDDTAPSSPSFALQAILTHFDTEDVPYPKGQVTLTMKGQMGTIIKTTS